MFEKQKLFLLFRSTKHTLRDTVIQLQILHLELISFFDLLRLSKNWPSNSEIITIQVAALAKKKIIALNI